MIGERVSYAVDVADLARQIEHDVGRFDQRTTEVLVADVSNDHVDVVETAEIRAVATVAVRESVEDRDPSAGPREYDRQVRPQKTKAAGNENSGVCVLS